MLRSLIKRGSCTCQHLAREKNTETQAFKPLAHTLFAKAAQKGEWHLVLGCRLALKRTHHDDEAG